MANVLCTEWQEMGIIDAAQHVNGERNCTKNNSNLDIDLGLDIGIAVQGPEIEIPSSFEMLGSKGENEDEVQMPADTFVINVKHEVNLLGTTPEESVAVEALRQLRGMFNIAEDKTSCDACRKQFYSKTEFQKHLPVCQQSGRQLHVCNVCKRSFVRKSDLGNHIAIHQTDKPHSCSVCGNVYRRKADLQNHMVSHQTSRPHQCQECGADFQRPSSLTNHLKIHSYQPGRAMLDYVDDNGQNAIVKQLPMIVHKQPLRTGISILNKSNSQPIAKLESNAFASIDETFYDCNSTVSVDVNNICASSESSNIHDDYLPEYCSQQSTNNKPSIGMFEYFEVPAVSAQVDIVTSDMNDPLQHDIKNMNHIQSSEPILTSNTTNSGKDASVEVESLSYFHDDESRVKQQEEFLNETSVKCEEDATTSDVEHHLCNFCGTVLVSELALSTHIHLDHNGCSDDVFQCSSCGEICKGEEHFDQHRQRCSIHEPADEESPACNLPEPVPVIPTQRSREKHCCTNCDKRFSTKQKLYRHMWIHRKKQFVCEVCSVGLEDQEALEEHRQMLHPGETPYVCQSCGRGFASRQGLWEHNRVHGKNSVSQYWCANCNKAFSSRQGYLIHTRTHTGERPYGCRFCLKAFRDGGTLRKHERIHTGERPHVCPVCFRAFNQKVVLREHVRWVHAANRDVLESDADHLFICEVCNHLLGDREELCAHIVKHSDDLAKAAKVSPNNDVAMAESGPTKGVTQRRAKKLRTSKKIKTSEEQPIPEESPPTVPVSTTSGPLPSTLNKDTRPSRRRRSFKYSQPSTSAEKVYGEHTCQICSATFQKRKQLIKHVHVHI